MKQARVPASYSILAWLPWLTLLVTLAITFAAWYEAMSNGEAIQQEKFNLRVAEIEANIRTRMNAYEQIVRGTAGLFAASDAVGRGEFRAYVDSLRLADYYPGMQCLGYAMRLSADSLDRDVAQIRTEIGSSYELHPTGARGMHTAIVYIAPFDSRNRRTLGHDMYSEPVRRAAMEQAWTKGDLAISGKVVLQQETGPDARHGFLMYLPVYRNGAPHATVAERRVALQGWIFASFRMRDLMQGVRGQHYGETGATLDLEIFDGSEPRSEALLYDSDDRYHTQDHNKALYKAIKKIEIGDRVWTIAVYSLPDFEVRQDEHKLAAIALSGVVGSLLLSAVLWLLIHGRSRALRLAAAMNRDVLDRERQLKEAQAIAHIGSWDWHVASTRVTCSDEMCRLFGLSPEGHSAEVKDLLARVHPDDLERIRGVVYAARASRVPFDLIHRIPLPDGRIREVRSQGQWTYTADGEAIRLSGTLMDVTEQMQSRRNLEASARYQQMLLEHLPAAVLIHDTDGSIRYCNAEADRILGFTGAGLLGREIDALGWRLLSDDGTPMTPERRMVGRVLAHRQALHDHVVGVDRGDGNGPVWVLANAFPQFGDDGEISQIVVSFVDITERRRSETVMRQALAELDDLYNHAPCGYHSLDGEGRVIRINQTELDWLGYDREEVIGKPFANLLTSPGVALFRENYPAFKALGYLRDLEIELKRKDGSNMVVLVSATAIFDADGEFVMSRSTLYDITARKLVEKELEQIRTELQRIIDISPAAIYRVQLDPEGALPARVAFLGRNIVDLVGYDMEAWHAPGFWEAHVHPEDKPRVMAAQDALFREGRLEHEYRFECRDGRMLWIYDRLVLVRDETGKPREIVGTWLDISKRIEAEQGLQRLNRFYALLSHTNEAIVRLQNESRLFEEVCRLAVAEGEQVLAWVGMLDQESCEVHPVTSAGRDEGYIAFLEQNGVFRHNGPTARAILENSHYINNDMVGNPVMGPWRNEALKRGYRSSAAFPLRRSGRPVGALTLYADHEHGFTDEIVDLFQRLVDDVSFALDFIDQDKRRRLAELRLARLNEDLELRVAERTRLLEAANKELEAFSYSVSHDLRAPLRSIDGFSQLLGRKYGEQLDGIGQDYLQRVQRASRRMGELIDDLLQLSRVSRIELIRETVDLSRIAREVLDDLQVRTPERSVEVDIQAGIMAHADSRLIRVVLENLLGNAWKFTTRQAQPRIGFGSREIDGRTVYFVRDNGAGFDMQYADKLFGAFQRLHRAEDFEGTGIGLATVQRIVNRHGGSVWVEAAVDKGATFFFALD